MSFNTIDDDALEKEEIKQKLEDLESIADAQPLVTQNVSSINSGLNSLATGGIADNIGGGGSGLTEPLLHTITTVTPVTLPTKTNVDSSLTNVFSLTLDRNVKLDITNPNLTKFQMIHVQIQQDISGNHTIVWPSSVQGIPSIDLSPLSETTISLYNMGDNIWRFVSTKSGSIIGSVNKWSQFPALQDVDFATFDGKNIDRLLLDQAAGTSLAVTDTGLTSDAGKNLISHVPTGASHSIQVNGTNAVTVNSTSVVSESLFPIDATPVTGDSLGSLGNEWARLSVTDIVLKAGANASKLIFDGDAATPKTYFTGSATLGTVHFFSQIAGVATNVMNFTNSNVGLFGNTDLILDTGQIRAGGATKGVENIGHLDFIDNTATPAAALSIYSDGTDLLANTGGGVKNLSDIGSAPSLALHDLTDVTISSPVAQHVLKHNGSTFVNSLINLGNLGDVILTAPATNAFLKYNGSNWIDSLIVDGDLPSTVVHTDLVQTFTSQKTFDAAGISVVVTNRTNMNGDVQLGNSSTDDLIMNGTVTTDISLLGDKVIRSSNTTEIGYLVTNDTGTAGSEGTVQIPTTTSAPGTAAVADSRFGAYHGAMGIQDTGSGSLFLYVRQSDGNWAVASLSRDSLT